jgi:hypothetical protein
MDQIVVHLSINHATLPRIQSFLSHLQIDSLGSRVTVAQSDSNRDRTKNSAATYRRFSKSAFCTGINRGVNKAPSISEQPLRCQQHEDVELSTLVDARKNVFTGGKMHHARSAATSLSNKGADRESKCQSEGVRVQKDIYITYNQR